MIKIGVMSDSHQNLNYVEKITDFLVKHYNIDYIVHLGDDYSDTKVFEKYDVKVIKVPGVFSTRYQDLNITNRKLVKFEGLYFMVSHTVKSHENDLPTDPVPEEIIENNKVDVFLYGHSHIPVIEKKNNILFINPGHLKTEDRKGYPPTVALLEVENKYIKVTLMEIDGKIKESQEFNF